VTVSRGEALAKAVEAAGVRCSVCLQHRFRQVSLRLKSILDSGELGPIISASASIRWWRDDTYFKSAGRGTKARDGGGVLLTQASHTLDLLLHLVGPHRMSPALPRRRRCARSTLRTSPPPRSVLRTVRWA
jgi:UDP-N-acetyl-2-amino-2-deoxyglucuronate dehydrogenase